MLHLKNEDTDFSYCSGFLLLLWQRLNSKRGHVYQFLKPQGFVLMTLLIGTEIQKRTRSLFSFIMIKLWLCCKQYANNNIL